MKIHPETYSFKDNAARVVEKEGIFFRYVFIEYKDEYDHLMSSGLFKELITRKLLIPHTEVKHDSRDPNIYTLIKPDQISFLSYPFEWSYNQWRKVILSYLEINLIALKFGMILKDATPYNFYLHEGNAVLFDTSSFAFFKTPDYWLSYKQFCEEMLGPFALMHYNGFKWGKLTRASHRGLPIDFISKNLALKSKLNLTCLVHLHLHANSYHKRNTDQLKSKSGLSVEKLSELISMIKSTINEWDKSYQYPNHWVNYYEKDIETTEYLLDKETTLKSYIEYCSPKRVVDLGANTGKFSEIASQYAETVIAYEYDETCVDYIESQIKEKQKNNLYTVIGDLSETSPNFGLLNKEHISIINRTNSDLVLALALVHHLALPKMIPFELITDILYNFTSRFSIVEFIERSDRKVQHLLKDNPRYYPTKQEFEEIISEKFNIIKQRTLESSVRTIYLLEKC